MKTFNLSRELFLLPMVLCALLMAASSVNGQNNTDGPKPVKEKVYVDYFTASPEISTANRTMVRSNVIEGVSRTNRVNVVDVDAEPTLKIDKSLNKDASAEDVVTDENVRLGAIKKAGGKYAMSGSVNKIHYTTQVLKDGSKMYNAQVMFTLKVADVETGETKATKNFDEKASSMTSGEDAILIAIKGIQTTLLMGIPVVSPTMNEFVNNVFPAKGCIIKFGKLDKNDNIEEVFVNMGQDVGINKGQKFDVFIEDEIGGHVTINKIGELLWSESKGPNVTACKITNKKHAAAIKEAGAGDKPLIVITTGTKGDGWKGVGKMFQ